MLRKLSPFQTLCSKFLVKLPNLLLFTVLSSTLASGQIILAAEPSQAFKTSPGSKAKVPSNPSIPANLPASAKSNSSPKSESKPSEHGKSSASPPVNYVIDKAEANRLATMINQLVSERFYDKKMVDEIWRPAYTAAREELLAQRSILSFAAKINQILAKFHTSHTQMMTQNEEAFYFMRCLFEAFEKRTNVHNNDADFCGLGVGGGHAQPKQVRYVLEGSPAAKAGFQRGDMLASVNGKDYDGFAIWNNTARKNCKVTVERQGKKVELQITPTKQDFLKGYVAATEQSAKTINHNGQKIGYVHFLCGGVGATEALQEAVCEKLKDTEALVLDLRDGYGAAGYDDMDIFFRPPAAFPDTETKTRKESGGQRSYYDRPLAILINSGVRSGKEMISYGFKQSKRGTLFGETTAGFVVAGQYTRLSEQAIIYIAVMDLKLNGERIEGKGVSPDVFVEDKLGSDDPVLEAALKHLSEQISKQK